MIGYALKPVRTNKRFSLKVKDYLLNIYKVCEPTGKRPDNDVIAEELKPRRNSNGEKMFGQDDWLSSGQIRSLFSNFVRKNVTIAKSSNAAYSDLSLQDSKTVEDLQMTIAEIETLQHHTDMIQVAAAIN